MRVMLTGATGLVGSRVAELAAPPLDLQWASRAKLDLSSPDVESWHQRLGSFEAILHTAAKTDVDGVEKERSEGPDGLAYRVNVGGTAALATLAARRKVPLVLVSTDFVFPVSKAGLFTEESATATRPTDTSWYGWTKVLAEREVLRSNRNAILRISYPYRAAFRVKTDHARRIIEGYRNGTLYPLYDDQRFTPTFIDDAADAVRRILTGVLSGVYHCSSKDLSTPAEFGTKLLSRLEILQKPLVTAQFPAALAPGRAPRPKDGGLATRASEKAGIKIATLDASLEAFARQWSSTRP